MLFRPLLMFNMRHPQCSAVFYIEHKSVIVIKIAFAAVRLTSLPATQTHSAAEARKGCRAMMGQEKPRILCVSRSPSHLEAICSTLPRREYEVLSATTPEQAVAVCVSNNVAAVVLDSEFLTEAGWSAAQTFKMVKPQLPVVLVGQGQEQVPPHGIDAIASTYSSIPRKLNALLNPR